MATLVPGLSAAAEQVVYRETFPVAEGEAVKLSDAGWKAWVYSKSDGRVHRGAGGYVELLRDKASQPADVPPVAANADDDAPVATGMLVNWNGGDFWPNPTLYLTEEFTLDTAADLTRIGWFQNNQDEAGGFRVALKIGTAWIVSDENFVGFGSRELVVRNASWRFLNVANLKPDAEATMTALPDGPLTAFGVFGQHTGYAELDSFTLTADITENEEPS
ncbi:MAG: hypothetical protein AAF710_10610 [Planctomycetota bacterium]